MVPMDGGAEVLVDESTEVVDGAVSTPPHAVPSAVSPSSEPASNAVASGRAMVLEERRRGTVRPYARRGDRSGRPSSRDRQAIDTL